MPRHRGRSGTSRCGALPSAPTGIDRRNPPARRGHFRTLMNEVGYRPRTAIVAWIRARMKPEAPRRGPTTERRASRECVMEHLVRLFPRRGDPGLAGTFGVFRTGSARGRVPFRPFRRRPSRGTGRFLWGTSNRALRALRFPARDWATHRPGLDAQMGYPRLEPGPRLTWRGGSRFLALHSEPSYGEPGAGPFSMCRSTN